MVADDNDASGKCQEVVWMRVVDVRKAAGKFDAPFCDIVLVQTVQLLIILRKHDLLYWLEALLAVLGQLKHSLKVLNPQ